MKWIGKASFWMLVLMFAFNPDPASALVRYKDVADLTAEAQQIIIGDVVEVTSFWNEERTLIKSRIVVNVEQYLVGSGTGTEVLEMDGGTVGDMTLNVSVLPAFEEGDHVLLFLGDNEIRLVQCFQGAYLTDGKQVARMNPSCDRIIADSLQPLPEFLGEIQQALSPSVVLPDPAPYTGDFELPAGGTRYGLCGHDWTYKTNPMGEDYKINGNCVDGTAGSASDQIAEIQNGFNSWNNSGADFAFTYGGTTTHDYVSYNYSNDIFFSLNPPGGGDYVAVNYHWYSGSNMTESDICFNDDDYTWWEGSGGCPSAMDIWNIATHELGHTLCLLDLYGGSDSEKTMYGYTTYCETKKRSLHSDDINGIIAIYGTGVDTNPPQPDPMTFATSPYVISATSIGMTATLATDNTPPIEYYFWASNGNHRNWNTDRTYTDNNAIPNTLQSYGVQARDSVSPPNVGGWSPTEGTTTYIEIPTGLSFGTVTNNSIELHADGTFTNLTVGSSGLYFNTTTAGGNGGIHAWVQTTTDTSIGLTPNKEYTYKVRARNQNSIATGYCSTNSKYTLASVPDAPTLSNATYDTMDLAVNPSDNPSITEFAIYCSATSDSSWNGKYVNSSGNPSASATWQTDSAWGTITIQGLDDGTQYCFRVKARNAELVETGYSTQSCLETQASPTDCPGDCNCDDWISWRDIDFFVAGMNDNQQAWEDMFLPGSPTCPFSNCDVNGDETVNWRDIDPLVTLMNTTCP
ncbi:MAG: matrixin family metalloprotease [Phycisphaerae bacterium]|nr:matrixin family metalloprotease [Phycisphaerae bacterium]